MPDYELTIIIPVFNQWSFTSQCLHSLREHTDCTGVQIIVVDNGPTDETANACAHVGAAFFGTHFEYIRLEENRNFGPACNLGAHQAAAQTLLFLNNDTQVTAGWLPPLMAALAGDERLGAVSPLLLFPGNELVQHLGVTFHFSGKPDHLYEYFPRNHPLVAKPRLLQVITGAVLCMRKSVFIEAGCFFEDYKNGYEDIDLSLTLGRLGFQLRCIPQSVVFHHTSQSVGRFDHNLENAKLLSSRHKYTLKSDIHLHAQADGYDIRINEWLLACICLPATRTVELCAWAKGRGAQQWYDMLQAEPLWMEGYDFLAAYFASQGAFQEALLARLLASRFYPSESAYIQLLKAAKKAGAQGIAGDALERLERTAIEPATLRRDAIRMVQWAKVAQEAFWETCYADWLKENQ